MAEFSQEPTQRIDAGVAGALPLFADAMKLLDLLLFDASNWDGFDDFATMGFEEGFGVDAVRFIATSVGFDVLGGMMAGW